MIGGHDHAAERGERGQGRAPDLAQLARVELALDLEPDDEEEHHHEAVVDPEVHIALEREAAGANADRRVQQGFVAAVPGGVGPGERDHRRREQDDAARRFDRQEPLDGRQQPARRGADGGP